jgi:hypothetical protein
LDALKKIGKYLARLASAPAEIRTERFPNTDLERYRYTILLGISILFKVLTSCFVTGHPASAKFL